VLFAAQEYVGSVCVTFVIQSDSVNQSTLGMANCMYVLCISCT